MLSPIRPYTNRLLSPTNPSSCLRFNSTKSSPPKFFSEFYNESSKPVIQPVYTQPSGSPAVQSSNTRSSNSDSFNNPVPIRDVSLVVATLLLSYFAVDNYGRRIELEKSAQEQQLKFLKSLSVQQNTFNQARKKKDLQLITERKKMQTREMKMVYHIALLREQLMKQGVSPIEIEKALEAFEKDVKMENSLSNVSNMALWVVDDSELKKFVPSIHEYDNKK
ncbi:hypothetical protein WICPIJ_004170 [Wickerhamomyces pijperi]|uniref:Uncharacterized protein n=1 Tax=Wickerhamomyces pijperi TaxID=599730 RepID=A0A9P8Q888_WICPI|nr:hypothetical protein WICPIJ_004170 [Wickerhamomyces pijperi]